MDAITDVATSVSHSVASSTTDVFFVVGVCGVLLLLGFTRGKHLLVAGIFAFYPALVLSQVFPWHDLMRGTIPSEYIHGIVFLVLWTLLFLLCTRFIFEPYARTGVLGVVDVVVLAAAFGGALSASLASMLPLATFFGATPFLKAFFLPLTASFFWMLAPLVALLVCTRR
jgi:hypothetical protein